MAIFLTLLLFAVFFVLSEVLKPKNTEEQSRAGLEDFRFPTASEGRPVPLIFGTVRLKGPNVVWYGDLTQEAITSGGGGGLFGLFSSGGTTIGFRFRVGIQFALGRGPGARLLRIWIGEDEIFSGDVGAGTINVNLPNFFGGDELGNGGVEGDITWFEGDQVQAASAYLAPFQQEGGDTPAYRGTIYAVAESFYVGNNTQIKPWAFEVQRIPNGLGLAFNGEVNDVDANPMNVLYEILTNDEWGLNFPPTDLDTATMVTIGNTLRTEGNGFSYVLDRVIESAELIREIERQADCLVFMDRTTGLWTVKLIRDDFDIDLVPLADDSNIVEVEDFSRGAWEDTVNHLRVRFADRSRDYFETFAEAQDMANVEIQAGANNASTESYPGVKDKTLANIIAWRDLVTLTFPLAKAKLKVDRTFWDTNPGDVIAWTNPELGFTKLAMRVIKMDFAELADGIIVLDLVQDIFKFAAASFGDPPPTGWIPPVNVLVAAPDDEEIAIEAPYGLIARDPIFPGQRSRVWAGYLNQGDGATVFDITQRNAPSGPGGSFFNSGTVTAFLLKAELLNALDKEVNPNPMTSIVITATPSLKATIQAAIGGGQAAEAIGLNLAGLCLIGDPDADADGDDVEFISFVNDSDPGGNNLNLLTVYRGLMDTSPKDHAAGKPIYLLFVGGGLSTGSFVDTNDVDVRLLTRSVSDQLPGGSAVIEDLFFDRRDKRPYSPSRFTLEASVYPTSINLDFGSTLDNRGQTAGWTRRDWRTPNEVTGLDTDASLIQGDFPAFNSTRYRMTVIDDPDGSPVTLFTTVFNAGEATEELLRVKVLRETDGVLTSRLRIEIQAEHDFVDPVIIDLVSYGDDVLRADFDTTFAIIGGHFNTGARDSNVISNVYTAPDTGTYTFNIGSNVLSSGTLEARINGGSFVTVIATSATTGTLAGVTATDTIEWRHTQSTGFNETFLEIVAPVTPASSAYGILIGD